MYSQKVYYLSMANIGPIESNSIKTRFLLNPFIWFSVVWAFVLILHCFNFTTAYPQTSPNMVVFLLTIITISIFLAFAFNSLFLKKLKTISISSKPIWLLIILAYVVLIGECLYSRSVPLLSIFSKETTYKDFGIPIVSGFMYSFSIFLSLICSLKLIYGQGNKKANFIALLLSYGRFVIVFSRGGLILCLLLTIIIYLTKHRFTWKTVLGLLFLGIVGLYLFNVLGNIRMGYSANDSSYLLRISQFNPDYNFLSNFSWGIVYLDSPLGNLLYNEVNVAPLYSFEGLFSQMLTSVVSERLFPSFSSDLYLVIPNLTVSTMFAGGYKYFGYFGMVMIYVNMVAIIFLSCFLCKKHNFALVGCASMLTILCAMSFFDNMFYSSGNSFALIYLILFVLLFYKKSAPKVNATAPVKVASTPVVELTKETKPKQASLTKNSFYYLVYNIFNAVFPFLTALYVTRILSSEVIGDISYALNIVSYFALFAFVGIPTYGMREIAKCRDDQSKVNKLFSELFIINTVTTTISIAAYLLLIFLVPAFSGKALIIYLVVGIEIVLNYFNISWLYEGLEKFGFISIMNVVTKIFSLICLILLVRSEENTIWYALLSVVGISGNYLLSFFFYPKCAKFTKEGLSFKQHFKPILLLVTVNLAIEIYSLLDITMIGAIMPDKSHVAYYKYAHQIQKTLLMAINTITLVLVPRLAKYYKDGKIKEYNSLITKTLSIIILLAIPMVVGTVFVSDSIVVWLYGDEYIASSIILKVLVPIVLISPIGYLLGSRVCLVTNHEKYMPIAVGVGALINIGLNAWFIILWGEVGAAIASLVSEIVVLVVYLVFSHKYFKLSLNIKNYLKILSAIILMSGYLVLIYFLVEPEILKVTLEIVGAIAIYFGVLLLTKEEATTTMAKKIFKRNLGATK